MRWLVLLWGKTATIMPDRIRAMHVSMTLERQRATMERKGSNYVYVILCIHIDPGIMGTSLCDCVSIYIYRERCVGKEHWKLLQQFSFKHGKLEREREHVLTPALGIKIISFYRIIHHVFCRAAIQDHTLGAEKLTFCSGESSFRTDGWGINYENLHSLEKAQTNLFSITWELVRTFFLIYLFFLTLFCTHAALIHLSKFCLASVCKSLRV